MKCKHEYKDADEYDGERWCLRCYEPWFISRILELEAENYRLREALESISTALDAYGVDYCRETAKSVLEIHDKLNVAMEVNDG